MVIGVVEVAMLQQVLDLYSFCSKNQRDILGKYMDIIEGFLST